MPYHCFTRHNECRHQRRGREYFARQHHIDVVSPLVQIIPYPRHKREYTRLKYPMTNRFQKNDLYFIRHFLLRSIIGRSNQRNLMSGSMISHTQIINHRLFNGLHARYNTLFGCKKYGIDYYDFHTASYFTDTKIAKGEWRIKYRNIVSDIFIPNRILSSCNKDSER